MPGSRRRTLLGAILSAACLAACAGKGVEVPPAGRQQIPAQVIHLGMTDDRVAERLGPPFRVVGRKEYRDGVMEVRHYVVDRVSHLEETGSKKEFYLYFWSREPVRWDRPDEWEAEADRTHGSLGRR